MTDKTGVNTMKNVEIIIIIFILYIFSTSCVNTKYIIRGNTLYTYKEGNSHPDSSPEILDTLTQYFVTTGFKGKIKVDGKHLTISSHSGNIQKNLDAIYSDDSTDYTRLSYRVKEYYFPEADLKGGFKTPRNSFCYLDSRPILQTLLIPLRIRPSLSSPTPTPSEASSSFNAGIGFGWKFNYNVFNPEIDIFESRLNSYSLSNGVFLGTGTTLLDASTSIPPHIITKRNVAILTSGIFLSCGFNKIHIGGVIGMDFALGPKSDLWKYQGKIWRGIILSYDLIK